MSWMNDVPVWVRVVVGVIALPLLLVLIFADLPFAVPAFAVLYFGLMYGLSRFFRARRERAEPTPSADW
jgi:hypothetical protein